MPIQHPSCDDFVELVRAELSRQIQTIDPTVFGSWSRGFTDGVAAAASALDLVTRDLETQLFPQTAQGEFLNRWGDYEGLERNPAAGAIGFISVPGVNGTVIPPGALFRSADGFDYTTGALSTVTNVTQGIDLITRIGTLATATTSAAHNLATGMILTVTGSAEANFNQVGALIAVLDDVTFTYVVANSGSVSEATPGTQYASTFASVDVASMLPGAQTNQDAGAILNIVTPITGIDGGAFVQIDGLQGGAGVESDDDYRARILLSRSIIEGVFTEDQVILAALGFPGNTRAFVKRPTVGAAGGALDPIPGQVAIYIMRDDDANPIPTPPVLAATKTLILDNGALPANTSADDVFVEAPTPVSSAFVFSALVPNTVTMQSAITAQLNAFFQDSVQFETEVTENAYIAAIQSTQDPLTGDFVQSFALTAPIGDIVVAAGQIAVLGAVTYP